MMYCSTMEIYNLLYIPGSNDEGLIVNMILAAGEWINRHIGNFIPITETRYYDGHGGCNLWVDPLIAPTSISNNGTILDTSEYVLYPRQRHWRNGPYTRIQLDNSSWTDEFNKIEISGKWGLYDETSPTLATLANQSDTSEVLVVDRASQIAPGMVIKVDDEMELITATSDASDSGNDLNGSISTTEEAIPLLNPGGLYDDEIIRIDFEQMRVWAILGNLCYVQRGWNGTARSTHNTGSDIYVYRSFKVKRGFNGTAPASHNNVTIYRCVAPYDVYYLCVQIATLMLKKGQSGFGSKSGGGELGEVFYYDEFPKQALNRIMRNYRIFFI